MAEAEQPVNNAAMGMAPNITNNTSGTPELFRTSKVDWQQSWRRWQRVGCTVKVQLPYVGTGRALFGFELRPDVFTNPTTSSPSNAEAAAIAAANHPVWLFSDPIEAGFAGRIYPLRGVVAYQYEAEPPLSRMARLCRAWSGSIYVLFRVVSNFTNQGDFTVYRYDGIDTKKAIYRDTTPTPPDPAEFAPPIFGDEQPNLSFHDGHVLGYTRIDLSEKKHVNIATPYFRLHSYQDRALAEIEQRDLRNTTQMILVSLDGTAVSSNTAQIQFNIDYCPGPDFMFHMPLYPFIFSPNGRRVFHFRDPQFSAYYFGDANLVDVTWRRARQSYNTTINVPEPYDDPFLDFYAPPTAEDEYQKDTQGYKRQMAMLSRLRSLQFRQDLSKSLSDLALADPPSPA